MIFAANFTWDAVSASSPPPASSTAPPTDCSGSGFALILGVQRPVPLRLQLHLHPRRLPGVLVRRPRRRPVLDLGGARGPRRHGGRRRHRALHLPPLATRAGANALLAIFVASLGIGIAGENLIRLVFCSASQQIASAPTALRTPIRWGDRWSFRWVDVWQVVVGRRPRRSASPPCSASPASAVRSRPPVATPRWPGSSASTRTGSTSSCFAIGTLCCGVAAFWFGVKYSVRPTWASSRSSSPSSWPSSPGRPSSPVRVFVVGIVVSLIEQLSTIWLEVRWSQLVVFVVLLAVPVMLASTIRARIYAGCARAGAEQRRGDLVLLRRHRADLRHLRPLAEPAARLRRSGVGRPRRLRRHRRLHRRLPHPHQGLELRARPCSSAWSSPSSSACIVVAARDEALAWSTSSCSPWPCRR